MLNSYKEAEHNPNSGRRRTSPEFVRSNKQALVSNSIHSAQDLAFDAYVGLVSPELIDKNEVNRDHGWAHIRRVRKYSRDSFVNSVEIVERPELVAKYARSYGLAERFHDIYQQLTGAKKLHSEYAAYFLLLNSDKLGNEGYSDEEIFQAAVMIYYHDKIENLVEIPQPLDFIKMLDSSMTFDSSNEDQLSLYMNSMGVISKESWSVDATRFDFNISEEDRREIAFFCRRLVVADNLDAIFPPEESIIRTSETFAERKFFVQLEHEDIQKIIDSKISQLSTYAEHDPRLAQGVINIINELERLRVKATNELNSGSLSQEAELQIRQVSGSMEAVDDLSRILYELTRDYTLLEPTSYEKNLLLKGLQNRVKAIPHTALTLEEKMNNSNKAVSESELAHISKLLGVAIKDIRERFLGITSLNPWPISEREYWPTLSFSRYSQ